MPKGTDKVVMLSDDHVNVTFSDESSLKLLC